MLNNRVKHTSNNYQLVHAQQEGLWGLSKYAPGDSMQPLVRRFVVKPAGNSVNKQFLSQSIASSRQKLAGEFLDHSEN